MPSSPADAYWLLRHAIACPDPVMYLEPKRRYQGRGLVDASRPEPPIGRAMVRRQGTDVTVVTYGSLVGTAVVAAEEAQRQRGWSLEVIDLRSLVPLDFDTVAASIHRTGRCVVMHEGPRSLGFGAELAARIQEEMFYELEAPVLRACGFDTPTRLRGWRSGGCPAPTGCWTASSARWNSRERPVRAGAGQAVSGPRPRRGLEEVTVTHWNVAVGDDVELNQVLCTVETAKAEVEIPSPHAGRVVETNGAEGDVLKVGRCWCRSTRHRAATTHRRLKRRRPHWSAMAPMPASTAAGGAAARWPPLRCANWPKN